MAKKREQIMTTPSTWEVHPIPNLAIGGPGHIITADDGRTLIAEVPGEANTQAYLLAAAPVMLKALERALKSLEWNHQWLAGEDAKLVQQDIDAVKSAICMAKREQS